MNDEKFHKYPKIKRFGDKKEIAALMDRQDDIIYIEEKIDGANFRFMPTSDGRIVFGSRNMSIGDDTQEIGGNFAKCVKYIISSAKTADFSKYSGLIFCGEGTLPHSVHYDFENIPSFIGFDIMRDGIFLDWDEKNKIFDELGLPVVKSVRQLTVGELREIELGESSIPISEYGNVKAEGIVLKNYRTQTFVKFVSSKFKEVNKKVFGNSKKFAADDNERLIATYCTNPRIDKHVFKLVDDGNELEMKFMQFLPSLVWADIVEEHGDEILSKNWKLDLRACRKDVSKRCGAVLEQTIKTQAYVK